MIFNTTTRSPPSTTYTYCATPSPKPTSPAYSPAPATKPLHLPLPTNKLQRFLPKTPWRTNTTGNGHACTPTGPSGQAVHKTICGAAGQVRALYGMRARRARLRPKEAFFGFCSAAAGGRRGHDVQLWVVPDRGTGGCCGRWRRKCEMCPLVRAGDKVLCGLYVGFASLFLSECCETKSRVLAMKFYIWTTMLALSGLGGADSEFVGEIRNVRAVVTRTTVVQSVITPPPVVHGELFKRAVATCGFVRGNSGMKRSCAF